MSGDGDPDFVVGAPGLDGQVDSDAGTAYAVVETAPPPPGNCGPDEECLVSDLENGAQLHAPAGILSAPATIGVSGILLPESLPGQVPSGKLLLGAAEFEPEGQAFSSPHATIHIPTVAGLEVQLTSLESPPVRTWNGSSWSSAGFNGTVVANPRYATRKAVAATACLAHVYAVFLNDADDDGIWDERDNCPFAPNSMQTESDGDASGDACDLCTDTDGDGFGNPGFAANICPLDNCPAVPNPTQADGDGDGFADGCDNCPVSSNASPPAAGDCYVYVITAGRPAAATQPEREGTMGVTRCMERSNFGPCP